MASTTTCVPPQVDRNGYGLRVPGIVISPWARPGYIDHQTLSFDAYLKLIEDRGCGERDWTLPPMAGRIPPTVRENVAQLGDLAKEFDFTQDRSRR